MYLHLFPFFPLWFFQLIFMLRNTFLIFDDICSEVIKGDNLGDNQLSHFMKWTVSFWRTAKWGRRLKSFSRISNKEQGREKQKMSSWLGPHSQSYLG